MLTATRAVKSHANWREIQCSTVVRFVFKIKKSSAETYFSLSGLTLTATRIFDMSIQYRIVSYLNPFEYTKYFPMHVHSAIHNTQLSKNYRKVEHSTPEVYRTRLLLRTIPPCLMGNAAVVVAVLPIRKLIDIDLLTWGACFGRFEESNFSLTKPNSSLVWFMDILYLIDTVFTTQSFGIVPA